MGADPRAGLALLTDTGLADRVLPELPALRLERDEHHQHKDVYEHTLTVLDQAIAQETDGPDLTLRLAALLHDIGKPATRRFEDGGGVSFHHHEVVGAKLVRNRLRALRMPKALIDDVAMLTFLHLRFHGYGTGALDRFGGAPLRHRRRRTAAPAAQAGARRLHHPQPARGGRRCSAPTTIWKRGSPGSPPPRTWPGCGPTWTATRSWTLLGVPPGPVVGRAWAYLKELRLEHGPLDRDAAEAALLDWAVREGIVPPD